MCYRTEHNRQPRSIHAAQLDANAVGGTWWATYDVASRLALALYTFYYALATQPVTLVRFAKRHNALWWGPLLGPLFTAALPLLPGIFALAAWTKRANEALNPFTKPNWQMAGPGRIFFLNPPSLLATLLFDAYTTLNNFIGQFMLCGAVPEAIDATWYDSITTKEFWNAMLDAGGARRPQQLGVWDGAKLHDVGAGIDSSRHSLVCKIVDSYLGIGDRTFVRGGERESSGFEYREQIEQRLEKDAEYDGKRALLCELVSPTTQARLSADGYDNNVHSLDIVTLRTNDGVIVVSVVLWTDCTDWSSHSASAGYLVDYESETVVKPCSFYAPYFATQPSSLVGRKVPGAREAVRMAVAAHGACPVPWVNGVGWDAMITDDGPVFFEGNVAAFRLPRRMTLTPELNASFLLWMESGRGMRAGSSRVASEPASFAT